MNRILPILILGFIFVIAGADGTLASDLSQLCAVKDASAKKVSEEKVRQTLASHGYTDVRGLGMEDGCIEAKGFDKNGKRFEVYLHPMTGEIVKSR